MAQIPKRIHFRVDDDTLKSSAIRPVSALFHAVLGIPDLEFRQDIRDEKVFSVELPPERESGIARRLVNELNKAHYISEAWDEPVRARGKQDRGMIGLSV